MAMSMSLADAAPAANLYGWYVGFGVGLLVVVIVAILVGWILYLALKIGNYAPMINDALRQAEHNTAALGDLRTTINHAVTIVGGLERGRARLGG